MGMTRKNVLKHANSSYSINKRFLYIEEVSVGLATHTTIVNLDIVSILNFG